jgi:hypothetical protein
MDSAIPSSQLAPGPTAKPSTMSACASVNRCSCRAGSVYGQTASSFERKTNGRGATTPPAPLSPIGHRTVHLIAGMGSRLQPMLPPATCTYYRKRRDKKKNAEVVVGVWIVRKRPETRIGKPPYQTPVCGENRWFSPARGQPASTRSQSSPNPVDNPAAYPRGRLGYPRVRTPCCPHCAHLIPNDWRVIHNSTAKSVRKVYVHLLTLLDAPNWGKLGDSVDSLWMDSSAVSPFVPLPTCLRTYPLRPVGATPSDSTARQQDCFATKSRS